jgi:hypothetical protein
MQRGAHQHGYQERASVTVPSNVDADPFIIPILSAKFMNERPRDIKLQMQSPEPPQSCRFAEEGPPKDWRVYM